jgi:hypothetical protein
MQPGASIAPRISCPAVCRSTWVWNMTPAKRTATPSRRSSRPLPGCWPGAMPRPAPLCEVSCLGLAQDGVGRGVRLSPERLSPERRCVCAALRGGLAWLCATVPQRGHCGRTTEHTVPHCTACNACRPHPVLRYVPKWLPQTIPRQFSRAVSQTQRGQCNCQVAALSRELEQLLQRPAKVAATLPASLATATG